MPEATSSSEIIRPPVRWIERHFGRVTSGGRFIPLIDGLRFVAIAAVVLYHLNDYLVHKRDWTESVDVKQTLLYRILSVGGCGVPLFFAISGFILGLPFLEKIEQRRPLDLKAYFLRRITRLEPPYVLNLILITALLVLVKGESLKSLLPSLLASIGYLHNVLFGEMSRINFVTWSLEIEVQFYILAPLIALSLYSLPRGMRRCLFAMLILVTVLCKSISSVSVSPRLGMSLLMHYEQFLVGMLLADVYHSDWQRAPVQHVVFDWIGLAAWMGVLWTQWSHETRVFLPVATFAAYYATFRSSFLSKFLSHPLPTTIGGMCYTIYLYHFYVISLFGRFALSLVSGYSYSQQLMVLILVVIPAVLASCSVFFAMVERPFMIWKPFSRSTRNPAARSAAAPASSMVTTHDKNLQANR